MLIGVFRAAAVVACVSIASATATLAEGYKTTPNLGIEVHQNGEPVPMETERLENGQAIQRVTLAAEPFRLRTPEQNWTGDIENNLVLQITTMTARELAEKPWDRDEARGRYYFPGTGMAQEADATGLLMITNPECDNYGESKPVLAHQYIVRERFDAEEDGFRDIHVKKIIDYCAETNLLARGKGVYIVFLLNRAQTNTMSDGFKQVDADILHIVFSMETS